MDKILTKQQQDIINDEYEYISVNGGAGCAKTSTLVEKLINLCALRESNRTGAPINKPQQWRFLSKILEPDENINSAADRESMIHEVMEEKNKPEDVWRTKESERRTYTWKDWLNEVYSLLEGGTFGQVNQDDPIEKSVFKRLWEVLGTLEEKTSGGGA